MIVQLPEFSTCNADITKLNGIVVIGLHQDHGYFLRPSMIFSDIVARALASEAKRVGFIGNAEQQMEFQSSLIKPQRLVCVGLGPVNHESDSGADISAALDIIDVALLADEQKLLRSSPYVFLPRQNLLALIRGR